MDDPGEEWEYEESCDSLVESRKSGLSWLWSNGLWLGKKVVVTGVVISSAPLLFPPLVVATFLGIAVSVPAGVVLVCYTCTEKLMNRLLPCPASPSTVLEDEEVADAEKDEGVIEEPEREEVAMEEKEQEVVSSDIKDIEEPEQEDGSAEKVAMAEKGDVVSSDIYIDSIKDIEEPEQEDRSVEEVAVAEKEPKVINNIKDSKEPEQTEVEPATIIDKESYAQGGNEYNVVQSTGSSDEKSHPKIEGMGGVDKKESSNKETVLPLEAIEVVAVKELEEVATEEKEQEIVSADMCVNSIKDSEEPEQNEVEPALILLDKKSHVLGADEYNEVDNTGLSDEMSHPTSEDLGGVDKKESSNKEPVFPLEAIEVVTVVQEDTEYTDLEKPAEVVMVSSAAQETSENPAEENILEERTTIEVVTLIQEDTENADVKKAAEIVLVASAAQDTSGNTAEEKILEEKTTAAVKKVHDDAIKHEHTKKKNHKKKSKSNLKTSHGIEESEDHKSVEHTKETGRVPIEVIKDLNKSKTVDRKGQKADHNNVKGDETTSQVASSVPTVEMKSVILESSVGEGRSTTTKRDEKSIRHRHVPIVSSQAGENPSNVDENVKLGMKNKESMKEIMIEDKAANDNLDKQRAIYPNTKPKGTTGNIDKRRAESATTGVHKDHPLGGGFHTSKQDSGTHKAILANEKKLWDQIEALRLIVGYKTAKRTSLIEEVKALYAFTGVKPPSPFKNSDNIHVTEEKLHFLMSIVGVK